MIALDLNFDGWQNLQLEIIDRNIQVYLNGENALSHSYEEHAGKVVGLRVRFVGSGELHWVKMWDGKGKLFFDEDFLDNR